jgi:hypothetical protein
MVTKALATVAVLAGVVAVTGCTGDGGGKDLVAQDVPPEEEAGGDGTVCTPSCLGKACGDDGCGGTCGNCPDGFQCNGSAQCLCLPKCEGKVCGSNGCGGSCGDCGAAEQCNVSGQCECKPKCENKNCGDNGCGSVCGECEDGSKCIAGICQCQPVCAGKECGPDGCGSLCGECEDWEECVAGKCTCEPACEGKECGDDGCNGQCGTCPDGVACEEGKCGCEPSCEGKECGDDGCGGSCGSCSDECPLLEVCDLGQCKPACLPDCEGKACGNDGCGCSCGDCPVETPFCMLGECVAECTPDCTDMECGDDGCGGSCGDCADGELCIDFTCAPACPESECEPMAVSCTEDGSGYVTCLSLGFPCIDTWAWSAEATACDAGWTCTEGICLCTPACDGLSCGPDGCGGHCGFCSAGFICTDGACTEAGTPSLLITDILPEVLVAGESAQLLFEVQAAEVLPGSDIGIWCFVDGQDAGTTQELQLTLEKLPLGMHQVCCQLTELGVPLPDCAATDCQAFKSFGPCSGPGDKGCDDNNACSSDACVSIGGGLFECHYGKNPAPGCCLSDFDCGCKDGQWTVCVPDTGKCFECSPSQCDDNNACTTEECVDDVCVNTPLQNCCLTDAECDDAVACTADACLANKCTHTPSDALCDDGVACTVDKCSDGACSHAPDNTVCDDGVACTEDKCSDGACHNTPLDAECDDASTCTVDTCDPVNDCQHLPAENGTGCPDSDKCNGDEKCQAGLCQAGVPPICDDAKLCTDDSCDPVTGCVYTPDDKNSCSDGLPCNGIEACKSGECKPGTPPDCADSNPCTDDSCVNPTGCIHPKKADGTACPGGTQYSCLAGECVCKPACTGKECGSDGCGGSCGTCPQGKACNNTLFKCEDLYTCADMMVCAQNCNFVPLCLMGCYGQGSPTSKALLDNFTNCVLVQCGINATPTCIAAAMAGACKASYDACMADI